MRAKALVATAILAAPVAAHARQWTVVSLDSNKCLDERQLQQETIMNGGSMLWASPAQLMYVLRYSGVSPKADVKRFSGGRLTVFIQWTTPNGDHVGRLFFSDATQCQKAVADIVKSGSAPAADDLR